MITKQTIKRSMEEISDVTGISLTVFDLRGNVVTQAGEPAEIDKDAVLAFASGTREEGEAGESSLFAVWDEEQFRYVLACTGEQSSLLGKVVAAHLHELLIAYQDRFDKNNFFQNLLLDNMLLVDIYNRAKKLHIEDQVRRVIYLIEVSSESEVQPTDYLNGMFAPGSGDYVTAVDETSVIVVKALAESDAQTEMENVARSIVAMLNAEAMVNARVAFGTPVDELKDLSKSYKEAMLALEVGKIFYAEQPINAYSTLGIGRLIYQLPANLCRMFISEVFGDKLPLELDEETRITIDQFFENDLNVSETARKLFVHRNTLVYRIDKLQKDIGLDIRDFDDALTLKISLMVDSYLKYLDSRSF
ncbi:MAG: helix-turn-helix domain-containing protein [Lachnospiraceae bacterium]|nr:helix-turn-helix domain-containing protein [Lachnospiraceae bacterium]